MQKLTEDQNGLLIGGFITIKPKGVNPPEMEGNDRCWNDECGGSSNGGACQNGSCPGAHNSGKPPFLCSGLY